MAAIPKKAATVILIRDKEPDGFEVLLLKRHEKSSFMGGNFVYPGGRVDRDDGNLEICSYCKGLTPEIAHQMFGGSIPPNESFAYWIAGIRELFEEADVLLAYNQNGNLLNIDNQIEQEKYWQYRNSLQQGKMTICQIAQEGKLLLALDQLHYYAHWITPEARSERFDTRFFLARHPEGQEAKHDQKETTAGIWLSPNKALKENIKGEVILSPPTLKTLEDLSRFKSTKEVFESLRKNEIHPVLPVLIKLKNDTLIIFPWDPEYEMFQRGEIPSQINYGRPTQLNDNTTRLLLSEGRWVPFCKNA